MRLEVKEYKSYYRAEFIGNDNIKTLAIGYSTVNAHRNLMLKLNAKQFRNLK